MSAALKVDYDRVPARGAQADKNVRRNLANDLTPPQLRPIYRGDAIGAPTMKMRLLTPLFATAFLALSLAGCSKEPAPTASAPKAPTVMKFDEAALFDFDKADLKSEGKGQLDAYHEKAKAELSSAEKVRVVGYTDNTGTAEYNSKLSKQRAEVVRDYLVSVGVDAKKMDAVGAADTNPIADNSTKEGQAKNRRVEIEVTGLPK
jgi:outer membrane protein OmpA-like peptidoglycan-associated protein